MKNLLLLFVLLSTFTSFSQHKQEQYQRAKISYAGQNGLLQLEKLGLAVEHGTHKKGYFVISDFSVSEIETARVAGFQVDVLIQDSKEHFLQQNRNPAAVINPTCAEGATVYETPENFNLGNMGGYLTYQEMLDELDAMKALYPNLITEKANISNFLTEGQPDNSVTPSIGGNGIKWVKISDNPTTNNEGEPQILYSAIHHAREPASLSQLIFYMWYLLENYDSDPKIQNIVNNTELYFVPVVNPDGYLYNQKTNPNGGGFWRKNRKNGHGVDNNRNYDYFIDGNPANGVWGGAGTSSNTTSEVYHGTGPFSEVENQAMKWFVENHDFIMAFNNHTSGNLLLYPYGYENNVPTPENALFKAIGDELVSKNAFTNQISSDLYPAAGTSDDFMYGTVETHNKIYSYTPEIGPSFWPPSNQIEPIAKSMMYLNITAAQMVNNFAVVNTTGSQYVGSESNQSLEFDIKRLGIGGSGSFAVNLEAVSNNISWIGGGTYVSKLDLLETQSSSIDYVLAPNTTSGDDIVFDITVNNGSYVTKKRITKKFGTLTPIFEDEGNSVTTNFTNNGWGTTTHTFVSPSSAITDSPNGNYQNNQNKTITLRDAVDLSSTTGANLSFYAKWDIEASWDYVQVEVSIDNGGSWIPQCGKYTNVGSSNPSQPTGEPLYDGIQNEWVLEEIDLSDYIGESILVRFQFASDNGQTGDGFYFDDLKVNTVDNTTLNISTIEDTLFQLFPNPVQHTLNIITQITNYKVDVFNVQGQLIYTQESNTANSTIDYSSFASGVYIMKITSEDTTQTFKILKK